MLSYDKSGFYPVEFKEGAPVNLTVFNPDRSTHFTEDFMRSKSRNTPLLDKEVEGHVEMVVLDDNILLDRLNPAS